MADPHPKSNLTYSKNTKIAWIAARVLNETFAKQCAEKSEYSLEELRKMVIPLTREDLYLNFARNLRFRDMRNHEDTQIFPLLDRFWDSFEQIKEALDLGGETITADFFRKGHSTNQSLQSYAEGCRRHDATFNPKLWVGQEKEFISYYMCQHDNAKRRNNLDSIRKQICHLEGRPYRMELIKAILGRHDLDLKDLIDSGDTETYEALLTKNNIKPHPDDVFIPLDKDGNANFKNITQFNHFGKWALLFKKYGHKIDVKDLKRKYGTNNSIVEEMYSSCIPIVFDAKIWDGQLDGMIELWDSVSTTTKKAYIEVFWENYVILEDKSYRFPYKIDPRLKKAALDWPLRQDGLPETMTAYGTQKFWSNFDKIQDIMIKHGTPITVSDLVKPVGDAGETVLMKAVKFGSLYEVLSTIDPEKGEYLTVDDLTKENKFDVTALDYIIDNGQLEELFDVRIWRGNPEGMKAVWEAVPDCVEKRLIRDFGYRMAQVNRENLRRPIRKKPRLAP